ncbi:MAG: hypothetical protein ACRC2M_23840 [Planktothrix sp.]
MGLVNLYAQIPQSIPHYLLPITLLLSEVEVLPITHYPLPITHCPFPIPCCIKKCLLHN